MIFCTGDTHGSDGILNRFNTKNFPEQKEMTREDHVIVAGDFGGLWENKFKCGRQCREDTAAIPGREGESSNEAFTFDWLAKKNFTLLFVDGNHECFPRIYSYPIVEYRGGKAHQIRDNVYHLMRGEIYLLEGKKFFAFGGAASHDIRDGILDPADFKDRDALSNARWKWYRAGKMFRVKNISWWEEEMPTKEAMDHGWANLEKNDFKVDYIITHSPSSSQAVLLGSGKIDALEEFLEEVRVKTEYKIWIFGHMHEDRRINERDFCLYYQIVRVL